MGTFFSGLKVNTLDLSPNHAGIIMALVNGIGSASGAVAPTLVGFLTIDVCDFCYLYIYKYNQDFL